MYHVYEPCILRLKYLGISRKKHLLDSLERKLRTCIQHLLLSFRTFECPPSFVSSLLDKRSSRRFRLYNFSMFPSPALVQLPLSCCTTDPVPPMRGRFYPHGLAFLVYLSSSAQRSEQLWCMYVVCTAVHRSWLLCSCRIITSTELSAANSQPFTPLGCLLPTVVRFGNSRPILDDVVVLEVF